MPFFFLEKKDEWAGLRSGYCLHYEGCRLLLLNFHSNSHGVRNEFKKKKNKKKTFPLNNCCLRVL
jgi:hypothetical protein